MRSAHSSGERVIQTTSPCGTRHGTCVRSITTLQHGTNYHEIPPDPGRSLDDDVKLDSLNKQVTSLSDAIRTRLASLSEHDQSAWPQVVSQIQSGPPFWAVSLFKELSKITTALAAVFNHALPSFDEAEAAEVRQQFLQAGTGMPPRHSILRSAKPELLSPRAEPRKRSATDGTYQRPLKQPKQEPCSDTLATGLLDNDAIACFNGHLETYREMLRSGDAAGIAKGLKITRNGDSEADRYTEVAQYLKVELALDAKSQLYGLLSRFALITSVRKLDETAAAEGYQILPKKMIEEVWQRLRSRMERKSLTNKISKTRRWLEMLGKFHGLLAFVPQFSIYDDIGKAAAPKIYSCLEKNGVMAEELHKQGCEFLDCIVNGKEWQRPDGRLSGPQLQLSTSRVVSDTAQSVACAVRGDVSGLQRLFAAGLASPTDVSISRGYSLVRVRLFLSFPFNLFNPREALMVRKWALYGGMHQYETVRFLINQGAVVDEE
ncbi:ankyrin repeat containing protein [Colletotrichum chrysophilum]|uniref:Ankyrin repeat containing protein n=1 Tax=Colletotrichum chrysophilum TaxID=1836956 RepID=A0AAD9A0H2_9PEZI|nr:ankyrin repeat containing protein [Colletotrichum chrysophilum]